MATAQKTKTLDNLIGEIKAYADILSDCIKNDNDAEFIGFMNDFRMFLKEACIISNGYIQLFERFIQDPQFIKFRDFFMFCEAYHERLLEIKEKEALVNKTGNITNFSDHLTLEYNQKFYQDILKEFSSLQNYMVKSKRFVMVGCGSLPITLFSIAQEYKKTELTGIDNSLEAIINAKELKEKIKSKRVTFDIVDGINYDYYKFDTIFIANLVIQKTEVLKRIAMTSKPNTLVFMRVPVLYGNLLSEDVNYVSMNSLELIDSIEPSDTTDDILYKIIVLRKK